MSTNKLVVKGSFLSAVVLFSRIAISFFLMPFIIRMLGMQDYGFWLLIAAFVGYYGMLDFGISGAVLRFVSREIGAGRQEETKYYINSAFFVLCGLGSLIIVLSFCAAWGSSFFIVDKGNLFVFKFAIIILGLSTGLSFPLRVFDGALGAHLRFDLKRYIEFGEIVFRTVAIIILLKMGYGLYGLVIVTAMAGIGELLVKTVACLKIDRQFSLGIKFFKLTKIKEMGEFAFVTFLNAITNILTSRLDPYVVALVSNVTTVAFYGVALTLTNYFGEFFRTTQGVLFPLFSQKEGAGDFQGLEQWLTLGSRLGTVIAVFTGGLVLLYGRSFLGCWLGPDFHVSYLYLAVLIAPIILAYGVFPSIFVLNSTGKHRLVTILDALKGTINLFLSFLLGYKMGAVGVAWGTAIPCIVFDFFLKPYYACKSMKFNAFIFLGGIVSIVIRVFALIIPVWYIFGRGMDVSYTSLLLIFGIHLFVILILGPFVLFRRGERRQIISLVKLHFRKRPATQKLL